MCIAIPRTLWGSCSVWCGAESGMDQRALLTAMEAIAERRRAAMLRRVMVAAAEARAAEAAVVAARQREASITQEGLEEIQSGRARLYSQAFRINQLAELKASVVNVNARIQTARQEVGAAIEESARTDRLRSDVAQRLLKLTQRHLAIDKLRRDAAKRHVESVERRRIEDHGDVLAAASNNRGQAHGRSSA